MKRSYQIQIWNRAATEAGGSEPREGDTALAALLYLHGMVMNGGIDHAVEVLSPEEYTSALNGYRYFGFEQVAKVLESASVVTTESQIEHLNKQYGEAVPNDSALMNAFQVKLQASPEAFTPVEA